MRENQSTEAIIQNLKDAGCDSDTIENFMADLQKGKRANGLKRLAVHRKICSIPCTENRNVSTALTILSIK